MTPESVGPLSRPFSVERLPPEGAEEIVTATPEERAALAADFGLPAIQALSGHYRLTGSPQRVRVVGQVTASITQICVVTLDPFDSDLEEDVEVDFAAPGHAGANAPTHEGADPPDEIVNGRIDLGALTAEFLALGLEPYPRKPGVSFDETAASDRSDSPFAKLERLKRDG